MRLFSEESTSSLFVSSLLQELQELLHLRPVLPHLLPQLAWVVLALPEFEYRLHLVVSHRDGLRASHRWLRRHLNNLPVGIDAAEQRVERVH